VRPRGQERRQVHDDARRGGSRSELGLPLQDGTAVGGALTGAQARPLPLRLAALALTLLLGRHPRGHGAHRVGGRSRQHEGAREGQQPREAKVGPSASMGREVGAHGRGPQAAEPSKVPGGPGA
jgi:hypothetical protein